MDRNCKNCGAPLLASGDCEYCGTKRQQPAGSGIEITADRITLWAGDSYVGTVEPKTLDSATVTIGYGTLD